MTKIHESVLTPLVGVRFGLYGELAGLGTGNDLVKLTNKMGGTTHIAFLFSGTRHRTKTRKQLLI